jgi:acetaldehyde dehydrogenase (acetylating)
LIHDSLPPLTETSLTKELQVLAKNIALKDALLKKLHHKRVHSMIPTAGDSLGLDRKTSLGLSTVNEGVYQRHKQYSNQQMLDVIKQTQVVEQVPKD